MHLSAIIDRHCSWKERVPSEPLRQRAGAVKCQLGALKRALLNPNLEGGGWIVCARHIARPNLTNPSTVNEHVVYARKHIKTSTARTALHKLHVLPRELTIYIRDRI